MTYYWWNSHWSAYRKRPKLANVKEKPKRNLKKLKAPPKQAVFCEEKKENEMLLTAKDDKKYAICPAGNHIGRCYLIADLGTQETTFGAKRKILFGFELPTKLMEDGRPFVISEKWTATISDKATLKGVLESWRGSKFTEEERVGFSPRAFLGKTCFVNVVHDTSKATGKVYANIKGIAQMPDGIQAPPVVNPPVYFMLDEYTPEDFELLPNWVKEKVKLSPEYQTIVNAPDMSDAPPMEDDFPADGEGIPF